MLTRHAEVALTERRLDRAWIERAVAAPGRVEPDPGDPAVTRSFLPIVEAGGRVLRVVHRAAEADVVVLTAFFDRGARRAGDT